MRPASNTRSLFSGKNEGGARLLAVRRLLRPVLRGQKPQGEPACPPAQPAAVDLSSLLLSATELTAGHPDTEGMPQPQEDTSAASPVLLTWQRPTTQEASSLPSPRRQEAVVQSFECQTPPLPLLGDVVTRACPWPSLCVSRRGDDAIGFPEGPSQERPAGCDEGCRRPGSDPAPGWLLVRLRPGGLPSSPRGILSLESRAGR